MKKSALVFKFACMCFLLSVFSTTVSAAITTNQPQPLPYTINNTTYTDVVVYYQDWLDRTIWFYYNPVPTSNYNGQLRYTGSAISDGGGTGGYYAVYCSQYGDNTGTLYCDPNYAGSILFNHNGNFTDSYTKSSQDIYDLSGTSVVMAANLASGQSSSDRFTWPVDPQNSSSGHYGWCNDWHKDAEGCYWLSDTSTNQADVWRDVQPFQLHYYHYKRISGYHLGADYNIASGNFDIGQLVYPTSKGEISEVLEDACGWGNIIFVRHDTSFGTYTSMYAHVDWIDGNRPVKGSTVDSVVPIAKVGLGAWNCGKNNKGSYSAHLHFEIREGDNVLPGAAYTSSVVSKGPQGQIDPNAFISTHR